MALVENSQILYDRPTFPAQLDMSNPLTRGLVGCWLLNDTGMRAMDSSPYNNYGILGGFTQPTNRPNNGLSFNGTNNLITIPNATALNFGSGDFTLEVWFATSQASDFNIALIQKIENSGGNYFGYALDISSGNLILTMPDGDPSIPTYGGDIIVNDGQIKHGVASVRRGGNVKLYVNGILDKAVSVAGNSATTTNVANLLFGRALFFNKWFSGKIFLVRLFMRALNQLEVQQLYLNPYDIFLK